MKALFLFSILVWIFIQDLKWRGIYWWCFPMLMCAAIWYHFELLNFSDLLLKIGFVLLCLFMLNIYISLKSGKFVRLWEGYFNLGDILFLLMITPLFSAFHFMAFFVSGTFATLVFHFSFLSTVRSYSQTVPYAGFMSLSLLLVELCNWTKYIVLQ